MLPSSNTNIESQNIVGDKYLNNTNVSRPFSPIIL